jgi:protein-L-isoaspartate(D-aspartate) O-methyltransferase
MFGQAAEFRRTGADPYAQPREEMIEHQLRARGVVMRSVLDAMRAIPRELFVSHAYAPRAYADEALPSQEGQTISQPYMVAVMTQELRVQPGQRILELGTGTGYQTAVLARLAAGGADRSAPGEVYTIERVPGLAQFAQRRLSAMEVANVHYFTGDGSRGWPSEEPWDGPRSPDGQPQFDRIMVTAGAPAIPRPLLAQLADGGIMIVPVGLSDSQMLMRVERHGSRFDETKILSCRFVPLLGAYAWDPQSLAQQRENPSSPAG